MTNKNVIEIKNQIEEEIADMLDYIVGSANEIVAGDFFHLLQKIEKDLEHKKSHAAMQSILMFFQSFNLGKKGTDIEIFADTEAKRAFVLTTFMNYGTDLYREHIE